MGQAQAWIWLMIVRAGLYVRVLLSPLCAKQGWGIVMLRGLRGFGMIGFHLVLIDIFNSFKHTDSQST